MEGGGMVNKVRNTAKNVSLAKSIRTQFELISTSNSVAVENQFHELFWRIIDKIEAFNGATLKYL